MGSNYYREKRYKDEWTKRIDIALLFQLQTICEEMKKRAKAQQDKTIADWANAVRLILATVNGEITNVELKQYALPEDYREFDPGEEPEPDLRILKARKKKV